MSKRVIFKNELKKKYPHLSPSEIIGISGLAESWATDIVKNATQNILNPAYRFVPKCACERRLMRRQEGIEKRVVDDIVSYFCEESGYKI